ncbi:nucleoside triphosphate pyrophosphohydrolase [candidate division GN15 bacterium]|nr:nucleoside triphosphate pyrophosphohydrolase [candidate division GN15 bacterium]
MYDPGLTPFERLTVLMEILRSPEGCAWDRKQTHESLVPYLIEEAYEVIEVIEAGRYDDLAEELGDLLTQVVFHAQLGRERGAFDINDAVNSVVNKLVNRHPHVFGERKDLKPQQVRDQWEKIKTSSGEKPSVLGGLPRTMPALTMAFRMGEKAGGVGFDWKQAADVLEKIDEELAELRAELQPGAAVDKERLSDEIGDLLFATASLARKLDIEPEVALRRALEKFRSRFERMELVVRDSGGGFDDYSLDELEEIWQGLKRQDR